jgi:predicted nucleic acid-binding protein
LKRYLLDSNHLSAYLDLQPVVTQRIDTAILAGHRFGICLPVLCEYRGGIRVSQRYRRNLARLKGALSYWRLWPIDDPTVTEFADIYRELRAAGRMIEQFDLLIAAVVRQHNLILLTADQDFQNVTNIRIANWL